MNKCQLVLFVIVAATSSCTTPRESHPTRVAVQPTPARIASVSGAWRLTVFARGATFREMLHLAQVGTIVTGHSESGTISTLQGSFNPPSIAWRTGVDANGVMKPKEIPTDYRGVVKGDSMEGTADLGVFGEVAWTAERIKP